MRLGVDFNILNQKGTPAFYSDIFANRPAFGFAGRVFISTDTGAIYEDTGSAWTLIADAGAGTTGTLQQVTTNGNTTSQGLVVTAGNVAIGTATASAPLDIHATGTNAQFNGTGTNNAYLQFQNAGANKWRIGNTYAAGSNNLDIYNNSLASNALSFNLATNAATFNNSVTATSHITSGGTSAQFVKGNGSLDSGTYLPITGGISTDQVLKVYSSGGNFYLGSSTISDNGTSVTINGRITSNSDTISVNGTAGSIQMQINNQTATTGKQWYLNSKSTGILGIGNNTASDVLTFASTGTATFLQGIQSTGTADQMLQVYGSSPSLRLYNTITSPTITGFVGMATGVNNFILGSASGDMCIGTSTAGKIYIGSGSTTVSPAMTVLSNGSIGIGTNSPTSTLDVRAAIGAGQLIQLANTSGYSNSNTLEIGFALANSNSGLVNAASIGVTNPSATGNNYGDIYFKTAQASGTLNERMRITSGGQVLIGQTSASAASAGTKCQILGDTLMTGSLAGVFFENRSGGVTSNTNWGGWYYVGTSTNLFNGSANIAAINMSTGVYTPLSDINKKKDFEDSTIGLNEILKLKPTLYRMKDQNNNINKSLGFIAQEVKEVIPQAYVENVNENDTFIGLNEMPIIATLVKAIQELNDKLVKNNIN